MAGGIDYIAQSAQVQTAIDQYVRGLQVPPGPPTQHGIYATPEWTGEAYPSVDWQSISQNQEPPAGWPRPPKFNEPGDVPGPPVQFGEAITNANVKAGYGFIPNGVEEKNLYYYHPDHLGSSSYITDREGQVIQHTEYIAFGETFVDEHSVSKTMPYLFNAKELDYETGLYYYGARYYDPKVSLWLNTDPLSGYNPIQETEHYIDGQHNGGIFNPMNMATYSYTYQNPILYIDPNGKQNHFGYQYIQQQVKSSVNTLKRDIINKYNNTKQTVVQAGRNAQTWMKNNKETITNIAKGMQELGDGIAVVGYGAAVVGSAFAGVGAVPGAKVAAVGNSISTAGSLIEIGTNFIVNDNKEGVKNTAIMIGSEILNKGLDRVIPGPTPDVISKDGVEILRQGNAIKTKIVEKVVSEKLDRQQDKTKDK